MVLGSFVAAIGWIRVSQFSHNPLTKGEEIALWIHSVMFSILGLLAVLGFIGCLAKSRGMVASFAIALAIHLGFSVASGIFSIYMFFRQNPQQSIDKCVDGSTEPSVIDSCKTGMGLMRGAIIAIYVLTWLLQLYAYFIVEWYVDQLDDEEMDKHTVVIPRNMVLQSTETPGPNNFGPTYPFTSSHNAHGATTGQDSSSRV
jgi:cellobiose-specific phosphotransferase system component IIC